MNVEIIKSKRKSIAIEIKPDLRIIVRAPFLMSDKAIKEFIDKKSEWINKNIAIVKSRVEAEKVKKTQPKFSSIEINGFKNEAKKIIPPRVEYFAKIMNLSFNQISIKSQVSRWGSCSALKNLNFNCLLVLCPSEVRDYVIIHELCHLKQLNHSNKFWREVRCYCPNYEIYKQWLKTEGNQLIRRLK